jgi:cytochrome c oxidase subunit II
MTVLLAILCIILIAIIVVQIGKVTELAAKIRGEEEIQDQANRRHAWGMLAFMVLFLVGCVWSALHYKNWMLGYGPHKAASEHGGSLDYMFDVTLFFTGIVFIITQILLFYFAYKYKAEKGRTSIYIPHDNRLEVVWTLVPAVVMTFLVVAGLDAWNEVMADVDPGEEHIEIEATGYQFAWHLRYPGPDGKLGARDYKLITGANPLGQDWTDKKNHDDLHPGEIVLPVGKKVRVRITARDVLHNFYLPHFRVKMDAVPGMPTYFIFTPQKTTEEYRQELSAYKEYQVPADPSDPNGPMLWEAFNFELACAELCGTGHYSMRRIVRIVSDQEYQGWLSQQQSYYATSIRGTDGDPLKDQLLDTEIKQRRQDFIDRFDRALSSENAADKAIELQYVTFNEGSAELTPLSRYELDNIVEVLSANAQVSAEIAGHTDNTGDAAANMELSRQRAMQVYNYLVDKGVDAGRLSAVGYGQTRPVDTNDTEAGREKNRRVELRIVL